MRLLKRLSLWIFVSTVLVLALLMAALRLSITHIEYFKPEIGYLLQRDVHEGIIFTRVSGDMRRFNPILRIGNVSINLPDRSQPLFIDELEIEFDFWASLRERTPVPYEVSGQLEKVEITRDGAGRWLLNEREIGGAGPAAELPGFSQLLDLLPRYLKLDLRRLIVRDQSTNEAHLLERVSAKILHRDQRFLAEVSAALPTSLGTGLRLKSEITRDATLVYLNASDLRLAPIARLFDVETHGLKAGMLDGEAWINMTGYAIDSIHGDLSLEQVVFQKSPEKPALNVDYNGLFNLAVQEPAWQISNRVRQLSINDRSLPGFRTQLTLPNGLASQQLSAWVDRLPVSSLPVVAGQWLPTELSDQIDRGGLQGELQELLVEIDFDRPESSRFSAAARNLSSRNVDDFPGITNLNADLALGHNKLTATLYGESVSLDFGDHFYEPLRFDSLRMQAVVNRRESGNLLIAIDDIVAANADARLIGRLRMETDGEAAPFMYLRASFSDAFGSATRKYIPLQIMPVKTIEWLEQGIVDGYVPAGDLQFHGRLRDIRDLAREYAGEFFVDFSVQDAHIQFAPGWAPATGAAGRVLFHNVGVFFEVDRGRYGPIDGVSATGQIASFEAPRLELDISAAASTADGLEVWRSIPPGEPFREVIDKIEQVSGEVKTSIDLQIPLSSEDNDQRVAVAIQFEDSAARVPDWGLELSAIQGVLSVKDDAMEARGLRARFFGDPVRIDVASADTSVSTRVAVNGELRSANLLRKLPVYLASRVTGKSDWELLFDIAGGAAPGGTPILSLVARSELEGTDVDLPEPFLKAAQDKADFNVEVDFDTDQIRFEADLQDRYRGRGRLQAYDDGYRMEDLDLALNRSLRATQQPGLHLYGQTPELSVSAWLDLFSTAEGGGIQQLESVDLEVDHALFFGRYLNAASLQATRVDNRYLGRIDSSLVKGSFEVPMAPTEQDPLLLNLDYLLIDEVEVEPEYGELRPASVPPSRLSSKSLRLHDMLFTDLVIDTRAVGEELEVSRFNLRLDALYLSGKARWQYTAERGHLSSMNLSVRGLGLGEAVAGLGFGDSLSGGTVDLSGGFSWPAPLLGFNLENLVGDAKLRVEDGVLNNVEPGSGRFVGLLSLSALPRRLSLDFSDVIIGGMEFDEITGSYRIENGELITRNTRMEGPAAKIKITGKTGILRRDYDQVIRVTPNIRHTLPLLGAVSAGSTVGWGLLLLQNVFKKVIDDAVEVEYRVTGSWDDPQIELIKAVDENQKELPKIDK